MSKPTVEQMADAKMHATVWGRAWDELRERAEYCCGDEKPIMRALASFAMSMNDGYRTIANGGDIID